MNIEKNITQIWIGSEKPPLKWMYTWRDKHPDWNYTIFTDEMMKNRKWFNQHLIDHYYKMKKWAGVSDLIRYELIYEKGGFWPEADMACLQNTEELFCSPPEHAYTCYENEKGRKNYVQPIMACNPGNEFVKHIIDTLHKLTAKDLHNQPFKSTGNKFLSHHIDDWQHKLTIWPSHYFIPLFYSKGSQRYSGPDKVYAEHYWSSTGQTNTVSYNKGV